VRVRQAKSVRCRARCSRKLLGTRSLNRLPAVFRGGHHVLLAARGAPFWPGSPAAARGHPARSIPTVDRRRARRKLAADEHPCADPSRLDDRRCRPSRELMRAAPRPPIGCGPPSVVHSTSDASLCESAPVTTWGVRSLPRSRTPEQAATPRLRKRSAAFFEGRWCHGPIPRGPGSPASPTRNVAVRLVKNRASAARKSTKRRKKEEFLDAVPVFGHRAKTGDRQQRRASGSIEVQAIAPTPTSPRVNRRLRPSTCRPPLRPLPLLSPRAGPALLPSPPIRFLTPPKPLSHRNSFFAGGYIALRPPPAPSPSSPKAQWWHSGDYALNSAPKGHRADSAKTPLSRRIGNSQIGDPRSWFSATPKSRRKLPASAFSTRFPPGGTPTAPRKTTVPHLPAAKGKLLSVFEGRSVSGPGPGFGCPLGEGRKGNRRGRGKARRGQGGEVFAQHGGKGMMIAFSTWARHRGGVKSGARGQQGMACPWGGVWPGARRWFIRQTGTDGRPSRPRKRFGGCPTRDVLRCGLGRAGVRMRPNLGRRRGATTKMFVGVQGRLVIAPMVQFSW